MVKLVKNFRSHNAILKFPNEQFYDGELQQCGDPKAINAFIGSPLLPSKKFPVVFHALFGKDDREASSPSFFNVDEVTQVKTYIEALRADRNFRISKPYFLIYTRRLYLIHVTADQDIGVVAPYYAQCRKIRATLKATAGGVKVGSVEEFQGQVRRITIV